MTAQPITREDLHRLASALSDARAACLAHVQPERLTASETIEFDIEDRRLVSARNVALVAYETALDSFNATVLA